MPITIQYGPAGLVGTLAVKAGEGAGFAERQEADLRMAQLNLQAQAEANRKRAQNKAFELQKVVADRILAAQVKTPVADHVKEKADLERATQAAEQKTIRAQMDKMLASGIIDQDDYQKGILAMLTGNKGLVTDLFKPTKPATVKPNISGAQEVDIIRQPFHERRRLLEEQVGQLTKQLADPFTAQMGETENLKKQLAGVQKQIETEFQNEAAAIAEWRQKGGDLYAPKTAPSPGTMSIAYTPQMSDSERDLLRWARELSGESSPKVGGDQATTLAPPTSTPTQRPPTEYPDAVWNNQHKMWTVVRNGRLMGVR